MGGILDPRVAEVAEQLRRSAGSYLQSTIRGSTDTCTVCGTPVHSSHDRCWPCKQQQDSGLPLADRVGSLVYAVKPDTQTYLLVHNYKTRHAGPSLEPTMRALLALGLRGHATCAKKLSGAQTSAWTVVPSTKKRSALHTIVSQLANPRSKEVKVNYLGSERPDREVHPELWSIEPGNDIPSHVLVIDDSWVTGSHAQGVASALKIVGVSQVSIFTVAKVLDPNWGPNQNFIKSQLSQPAFDKTRCPWTGERCP